MTPYLGQAEFEWWIQNVSEDCRAWVREVLERLSERAGTLVLMVRAHSQTHEWVLRQAVTTGDGEVWAWKWAAGQPHRESGPLRYVEVVLDHGSGPLWVERHEREDSGHRNRPIPIADEPVTIFSRTLRQPNGPAQARVLECEDPGYQLHRAAVESLLFET